jgi:hypothetical protein
MAGELEVVCEMKLLGTYAHLMLPAMYTYELTALCKLLVL